MSLSIGKYIYHALSGITGVTSINPLYNPSTGSTPYIVYKRKNEQPEYSRDGLEFNTTPVQIDVIASNYFQGVEISEQIRLLLEKKQEIFKGIEISNCDLTGCDEQTDGAVWVQSLNFEFLTN